MYAGVAAFALTAWTFFVLWAMSAEKASSSGTLLASLPTPQIKLIFPHRSAVPQL
jgi:hypothetical protein